MLQGLRLTTHAKAISFIPSTEKPSKGPKTFGTSTLQDALFLRSKRRRILFHQDLPDGVQPRNLTRPSVTRMFTSIGTPNESVDIMLNIIHYSPGAHFCDIESGLAMRDPLENSNGRPTNGG